MIEKSKQNDAYRLLTGFGISGIGKAAAKSLLNHFGTIEAVANASVEELTQVEDIGEISAQAIHQYFRDPASQTIVERLKQYGVNMARQQQEGGDERFRGKTFVITGTLPSMGRKEAAELIELHGGKVSGSVSKKTDYLVAGDNAGSKLDKANALQIPVLSEEELLGMIRES